MSNFRMGRNTTEHYNSFEEAAKSWGCKPVVKRTNDETKLNKQRWAFAGRHLCKACKQPMTYVEGTSTMVCDNEKCKGIKQVRTDADGNEIVTYIPSYDLLDSIGTEIAGNLFAD